MGGAALNFHARGEALWQERAHELHRSALGVSLTDKFVQKCSSCEPPFSGSGCQLTCFMQSHNPELVFC